MNENNCNDSSKIIAQALDEMKKELGPKFNEEKINLAELSRRTGISRGRLRKLKKNGFVQKPHGSIGKKADKRSPVCRSLPYRRHFENMPFQYLQGYGMI